MNWLTLVDAATLRRSLNDPELIIIDARFTAAGLARGGDSDSGHKAWQEAHIPGAHYAHLNRHLSDLSCEGHGRHPLPDEAAFTKQLGEWGITPAHQVVVYDETDGSMAAARLWWLLKLLGHARVAVLDGGLTAWRALSGPLTATPPEIATENVYPVHFDLTRVVLAEEVQARLGAGRHWLFDARATERFRGDVEPIDPVAGHVPGAVNRPLALNLMDGRFKSAKVLHAELTDALGGTAASDAVMMCGSGVTACHLLLAFEHAGLHGARVYAGSWSGWISDRARPVSVSAF